MFTQSSWVWTTCWNRRAASRFCPSYSRANRYVVLACGCLGAHLRPSWQSKSPREAYLTWCTRWHKQINKIIRQNALLSCTSLYSLSERHLWNTTIKGQKKHAADWWCPQISSDIFSKKIFYFSLKLLQCGWKIGEGERFSCECVRKKTLENLFRVQFGYYIKN